MEKENYQLKEKIGNFNIEIMKLRNENDRLKRDIMYSKLSPNNYNDALTERSNK